MARNLQQNALAREETQRRLVDAATSVFMRMGFAGAKMADIARAAELSHGLTYHYFPNKDAVFVAVVETTMGFAREMVEAAASGPSPAIERIGELCERMLLGARHAPAHSLIMLQTASTHAAPQEARKALRKAARRIETVLAALIEQAQKAGDASRGDPEVLARTLLATISGLAASMALGPSSTAPPSGEIVMRLLHAKAKA